MLRHLGIPAGSTNPGEAWGQEDKGLNLQLTAYSYNSWDGLLPDGSMDKPSHMVWDPGGMAARLPYPSWPNLGGCQSQQVILQPA
jgi:hypothetical protein